MDPITLGLIAAGLHIACKLICIFTGTPDPATPWGKVYSGVEVVAGVVGKIKEDGKPNA